jgi:predicted enzyme related to lactoylglutathione lyase
MINGFYCTNIFSSNAKALITFYRDVLEIPVQKTDVDEYNGVYFGFIKDAPTICIWDATAFNAPCSGNMSFVFTSDDLDKTVAELKNKGIRLEPPVKYEWGTYEQRLKDPEGNEIVIAEFLEN